MTPLCCVSESVLNELNKSLNDNFESYRGEGFKKQIENLSWSISVDEVFIDADALDSMALSGKASESDFSNSLLVYKALPGLTPSIANEERIWVRLSHVECFEYSKERWLKPSSPDDKYKSAIVKHFFAKGRTGIRDDHAISRLWWNAHIAHRCNPADPEAALRLILHTADIRSNLIERPWLTSRKNLLAGILRVLENQEEILNSEKMFRNFMINVNRFGGGIVFEMMRDSEIDNFLEECFPKNT